MGLLDTITNIASAVVNTPNVTGNNIVLKIGGVAVGMAQNVTITTENDMQRLYGVGDLEAQDMVPGNIKYTFSGEILLVSNKALDQITVKKESAMPGYPKTATSLVPITGSQWITDGFFDIEVLDKLRKETIGYYAHCQFERYSLRIGKHAIVVSEFSIAGMQRFL
ncbi:hypothetical protein [Oryzomonas rubra]|uniref:Uncharacterized protein n=1 Tax=Oryzomonas rubra TaxID=2509454 RepID=A0A5A9X7Z1_9BACT|nr:hypothetical protein [Oryzomonas rubra]KAA0888773.1 hypothetical protein ET418_15445 [Oryzomonas rubra]